MNSNQVASSTREQAKKFLATLEEFSTDSGEAPFLQPPKLQGKITPFSPYRESSAPSPPNPTIQRIFLDPPSFAAPSHTSQKLIASIEERNREVNTIRASIRHYSTADCSANIPISPYYSSSNSAYSQNAPLNASTPQHLNPSTSHSPSISPLYSEYETQRNLNDALTLSVSKLSNKVIELEINGEIKLYNNRLMLKDSSNRAIDSQRKELEYRFKNRDEETIACLASHLQRIHNLTD